VAHLLLGQDVLAVCLLQLQVLVSNVQDGLELQTLESGEELGEGAGETKA